jgi:hypothetical protein
MSLKDDVLAGLADISEWMGNPVFTWQGEEYSCAAGSAGASLVLGEGGFEQQADLVLFVAKSAFTDGIFPAEQQTLVYNGATFRIGKIGTDPMGATLKLTLTSATRGA